MSVLAVAEKPSVAKEVATILSNGSHIQSRQAFSPYNRIWELPSVEFRGNRSRMSITSVSGHLCEADFGEAYRWGRCQPEALFTAPLHTHVRDSNENIKKTLQQEAKKHSILFLWLDCDLEGEAIGFEVMEVCKEANPHMEVFRARFSALIPRDIFRAMSYPERPNPHMNDAVKARSEIDLRLGAAFTRFQSDHLKGRYPSLTKTISYGPCQFPTLGFVFDQYSKIQAFVPEKFWSINLELEADDPENPGKKMTTKFNWDRDRIFDQFICLLLYEECLENCTATVVHCNNRPTSKSRPVPLNLIELQKKASTWFRISGEDALKIAQTLYEQGIISYPRTETNFFKEGTEIHSLLEEHRTNDSWGHYTTNLLDNNGFEWPTHGGLDDGAHPPIHPLKSLPLNNFGDEPTRNIYELVVKHFLACCSKDAKGSQTDVAVQVPTGGEGFHCKGLMILERNYLEIYRWERWAASRIPTFAVGDSFTPKRFLMSSGSTTAPPPLTESDLIARMDENGIGTDATISTHIGTIQAREYVTKDASGHFFPTKLGKGLVEGYNNMGYQLTKPYIRASMERDMMKIARGEMGKEEMLSACLESMRQCFLQCKAEVQKLNEAMDKYFAAESAVAAEEIPIVKRRFSTCGDCNSGMDLRVKTDDYREVRYLYCPSCRKLHMIPSKGEITAYEHFCPICNFQVLSVHNRETSKSHYVCPQCFKNPPPAPLSIEDSASEFRCFKCAHPTCALATNSPDLAPCPDCPGVLQIRKTKANPPKYFVSCTDTSCRFSWWIPTCIRSVSVVSQTCHRCSSTAVGDVHLLQIKVTNTKNMLTTLVATVLSRLVIIFR